jgi:hypothetical protein
LGRRRFGKRLRRSERSQEKRKTTPVSLYNIGRAENLLDFSPTIDITFVRTYVCGVLFDDENRKFTVQVAYHQVQVVELHLHERNACQLALTGTLEIL